MKWHWNEYIKFENVYTKKTIIMLFSSLMQNIYISNRPTNCWIIQFYISFSLSLLSLSQQKIGYIIPFDNDKQTMNFSVFFGIFYTKTNIYFLCHIWKWTPIKRPHQKEEKKKRTIEISNTTNLGKWLKGFPSVFFSPVVIVVGRYAF